MTSHCRSKDGRGADSIPRRKGVVIGAEPADQNVVPRCSQKGGPTKEARDAVSNEGDISESLGLLKMDFLVCATST